MNILTIAKWGSLTTEIVEALKQYKKTALVSNTGMLYYIVEWKIEEIETRHGFLWLKKRKEMRLTEVLVVFKKGDSIFQRKVTDRYSLYYLFTRNRIERDHKRWTDINDMIVFGGGQVILNKNENN